jgi:hypothetical protein
MQANTRMGLDAVIYSDDKEESESQLAHKRIGNIATVVFLRDYATRTLSAQSLVVSKVLYDGTHCGDSLAVSELQQLAVELQVLERASETDVQTFARDMLALVHTALSHERPIHFS